MDSRPSLAACLALALFCAVLPMQAKEEENGAPSMQLHLFDLSLHPEARCNDGSPAGFYYTPGSGAGASTWIVHQQGGGWCYDEETCSQRSKMLTSSHLWPAQRPQPVGLFNATLPELAAAHKVYVAYCTSDAYIGNASDTTFGFQFRGRAVVQALFATLQQRESGNQCFPSSSNTPPANRHSHRNQMDRQKRGVREGLYGFGLGSRANTTILYSGCSAGARGALFNADFIRDTVVAGKPNITQYGVLLDSALWVDLAPAQPATTVSFTQQTARLFRLANVKTTTSPACLAHYLEDEAWKCIFGQYALPFVRSPFLLHAYLYDEFQLSGDLGIAFSAWPHTADQLQYSEGFRNRTTSLAHTLEATVIMSSREDLGGRHVGAVPAPLTPRESRHSTTRERAAAGTRAQASPWQSAMFPACYAHCATEAPRWAAVLVAGVSLDGAVSRWWRALHVSHLPPSHLSAAPEGSLEPGSFVLLDNCTGLACGVGCPPKPQL
jgi:O-palmitoleoyl-L-serine hydrolase